MWVIIVLKGYMIYENNVKHFHIMCVDFTVTFDYTSAMHILEIHQQTSQTFLSHDIVFICANSSTKLFHLSWTCPHLYFLLQQVCDV